MDGCTPGIITANAHLCCQDFDPGKMSLRKFIMMLGSIKFHGVYRKDAEFERFVDCFQQNAGTLFRVNPEAPCPHVIAGFLRHQIRSLVFFCVAFKKSKTGTGSSIEIAFVRTETIPCKLIHGFWQSKFQPELRKRSKPVCARILSTNDDFSVGINRVRNAAFDI